MLPHAPRVCSLLLFLLLLLLCGRLVGFLCVVLVLAALLPAPRWARFWNGGAAHLPPFLCDIRRCQRLCRVALHLHKVDHWRRGGLRASCRGTSRHNHDVSERRVRRVHSHHGRNTATACEHG